MEAWITRTKGTAHVQRLLPITRQSMAERLSRKNTIQEKRKMRHERKKRKRCKAKLLEAHLDLERTLRSEAEKKVALYKNMSRSYWERWRWELEQRKECMVREKSLLSRQCLRTTEVPKVHVHEIDPDVLLNPVASSDGEDNEVFVGRGSFGVVRLQIYRGVRVAVKELLPRTLASDVHKEAQILARFCHPYLPCLFGVVTSKRPHRIVMQYHGFSDKTTSVTLGDVLCGARKPYAERVLLMLCTQLVEAIRYLHEEVKVLHNDLKCNNVIVCDSITNLPGPSTSAENMCDVQVVVIDFGKATTVDSGKTLHLNPIEKSEYIRRFPHIAPELLEGVTAQTTMSDMYSLGGILHKVLDKGTVVSAQIKKEFGDIAIRCRSPRYYSRPAAKEVLASFENILTC